MSREDGRTRSDDRIVAAYLKAKEIVIHGGFGAEIEWQASRDLTDITESDFLREAAWVVLCSGFRESVVRQRFREISSAFLEWVSASAITEQRSRCRQRALRVFASMRKVDAIIDIARHVHVRGFRHIHDLFLSDPLSVIRTFPFMGAITSLHLAKNLGVPVVKPDRHLLRLAAAAGYSSPQDMCDQIAARVGDKIAVVDLVMWRYATIERDYRALFRPAR